MPTKYTYLLVDLCCVIFPFLFSFYPKINFYKQWKHFVIPCIISATVFIIWDIYFTKLGVWSFNPNYVVGLYFFNLPLEEVLFFICVPYACVFTYHCMKLFFNFTRFGRLAQLLSYLLIVVLVIIALLNLEKLYTSVTFSLLAVWLTYLVSQRVSYLATFYVSFLLILIPFFISNGILTGSWIEQPVVSYNNSYNLGIRMGTIPVEDTFYGMLLLLLNVGLYERKLSKLKTS